jgi:hypothetical protein
VLDRFRENPSKYWGVCWGDWCFSLLYCSAAQLTTTDSILTAWAGQTLCISLISLLLFLLVASPRPARQRPRSGAREAAPT